MNFLQKFIINSFLVKKFKFYGEGSYNILNIPTKLGNEI